MLDSHYMQKYDYIISGVGASGLILAYQMILDSFFDTKNILLIDKKTEYSNDRTWCFWEKDIGVWSEVVSKEWDTIYFGSNDFSKEMQISPYQYKLIRSKDFYDFVINVLEGKSNVTFVKEEVVSLKERAGLVQVKTNSKVFFGDKVFNSILLSQEYKAQTKYPVLNQHFVGWFVKTKKPCFDKNVATFMDFAVEQKENTRFMYVLPISETEALFEYTLFSESLLKKEEYEEEIVKYLQKKGIADYVITETEKGCIPMTCYDFRKQNSKSILHIGTAGGWTKPSTGYTFNNAIKNSKKLISYLKNNTDLSAFGKRTRFWYYDVLFIDVLYRENAIGSFLFTSLFKKNRSSRILKFLDEETTIFEEFSIIVSLPPLKFLKALWKRVFKNN